jgi:hypothetical protein
VKNLSDFEKMLEQIFGICGTIMYSNYLGFPNNPTKKTMSQTEILTQQLVERMT